MNLLKLGAAQKTSAPETITAVYPDETLDNLWYKASQIGDVSVEKMIWSKEYQVTIHMSVRESSVYARSTHHEIHEAMKLAIAESKKFID